MALTLILLRAPKEDELYLLDQADQIYTIDPNMAALSDRPCIWQQPEKEMYYFDQAFELIQHFAHRTYAGKKVAEHLMYKGESLFYFTRFILINRFTQALKEYSLLESIVNTVSKERPATTFKVLNTSPYARHFETDAAVDFNTRGTVKAGKLNKQSYYLLFIIRAIVGFFLNPFKKNVRHLFLFPQVEPQPLLDRQSLQMKKGNPLTDYYLQDLLNKKEAYILEERYPLNEGSYKINRQNIFGRYGSKRIFLEPYLLRSILLLSKSKLLKQLKENEASLFNAIQQKETHAHIRLLNYIHKDLTNLRKLALMRMAGADRLFKNKKIKVLGCIDEYSVKSKSIIDAASYRHVKTYALQHGVIHKNHMGYSYLIEDHQYTPFVNKVFVYSEQIKQLLQDQHYGVEQIIVSGQLRTDIIPILLKQNVIIDIEGIDHTKPIILYASQPVSSVQPSDLRDRINKDFMLISKEFSHCQFVLKPHPRETDWEYFYELGKSVEASDFIVTNADLYLLLSKCSMLLTHCSSVGQEAINFDKPLVVQDYPNIDIMNYIRDGIGFKAGNYAELKKVISGILDGELKPDKAAYEAYRQKWSGPIDGQVSQRILRATTV